MDNMIEIRQWNRIEGSAGIEEWRMYLWDYLNVVVEVEGTEILKEEINGIRVIFKRPKNRGGDM